MPTDDAEKELAFVIPATLDAGNVGEAHARLVAMLDRVEGSDAVARIDLGTDAEAAPLSEQLLVSAERSFPKDQVRFGKAAAAALAGFGEQKEY